MPEIPRDPVPPKFFGKDHWSTFAYMETRCVDYKGVPDRRHMRCDPTRHPGLAHIAWKNDYPTLLAGMVKLSKHDDWDCFYDLEEAGLLKDIGTGINPVAKLTKLGHTVAAALRKHKAEGKNFADFSWEPA
jgi:hypothetical protein